jgi:MFS family permease
MRSVTVYRYRWVILAALMATVMVSEMQWLVLAPISRAANYFYGSQIAPNSMVSTDLLTLIHLISFVVVSIPISYIVTKVGLAFILRFSALAIAVFSLIKGFYAHSFIAVVIAQIGLSVAYSAIMGNVTFVVARWFPLRERGFAIGLVSLTQYLGLFLVMIISPKVVVNTPQSLNYGEGIAKLLLYLGIINAISAVAVFFLFKEKPPTVSSQEPFSMQSFPISFGLLLRKKHMGGFVVIFGLVWGLFNVFVAKIDSITAFIGIENSNGVVGLALLGGGTVGSLIIPLLSDYLRKRKLFFIICMIGIFTGVLLFAFIPLIIKVNFFPLLIGFVAIIILGFFFQSIIPLGFQDASELSYPVQESSSQSVLLINGHFIGAIILLSMNYKGGAFIEHVLIVSVALLFAALFGVLFIKESPIIITEEERLKSAIEQESIRVK